MHSRITSLITLRGPNRAVFVSLGGVAGLAIVWGPKVAYYFDVPELTEYPAFQYLKNISVSVCTTLLSPSRALLSLTQSCRICSSEEEVELLTLQILSFLLLLTLPI